MPTGNRIRDNNIFGVTTDAPLTAVASTFNSLGLATMSAVVSAHALVTLDPIRQYGEPEIIVVTIHTSAATVATITRGAYGTTARSHPLGTLWVSQPIDEDFIEILTAATRPSNPYEGQFIFETDTNKLVGYGGVDWAPRDAGGQLGYVEVTTPQQTGILAVTDLTGLSVAVTVGTGRRVRISGRVPCQQVTTAGITEVIIKEGATVLGKSYQTSAASDYQTRMPAAIVTPSAGAHTYKLTAQTTAGTFSTNHEAGNPSFILVEDLGAA